MKYMIMMHAPRGDGGYDISSWPQSDQQAHYDYWNTLNAELRAAGEWVQVAGLTPPNAALHVRADANGAPITDGPFAESKEFLAGYWIVDVESAERAYAIAAKASLAPGRGGVPLYMSLEVRQVMSAPPVT